MTQNAGQRIVEIQRHRAGQLQGALQFLLVRQARLGDCPLRRWAEPVLRQTAEENTAALPLQKNKCGSFMRRCAGAAANFQ